jgi:hypothetical protein
MVRGMEVFREHFADFADCYVLIGGAACDLLMEEAGLLFRVTKDLDIVMSSATLLESRSRVGIGGAGLRGR